MPQTPVQPWTLEIKPGEKKTFLLTNLTDLKITNATLDPVLADENRRTTVVIWIKDGAADSDSDEELDEELDEETKAAMEADAEPQKLVLTSLTPGKIESTIHDIVLTRPATVACEVIGPNTVHLSGYFYFLDEDASSDDEDRPRGMGYINVDEEDDEDDDYIGGLDDEEDSDLEEDSELADYDSHRFEEVMDEDDDEEQAALVAEISKKRPRESDEAEPASKIVPPEKLSKKEKKRLKAQQAAAAAEGQGELAGAPPSKKQKAEDGKPIAVTPTSQKKDAAPSNLTAKKEKGKDSKQAEGAAAAAPSKKEKNKEKIKETNSAPSEGKTVKLPNGLSFTDKVVGSGATAKKGSRVSMRYIGKLKNGTTFDSNTNGSPFKFRLGAGDVIKGWDEGIVGMKEGGQRTLVVPPHLGYGKKKSGPIPPNSTLTFDVKLLTIP